MYCCTMWYNCTVTAMRKLRISYNNNEMFVHLNIMSFGELMRNCIYSFMKGTTVLKKYYYLLCKSTILLYSNIWSWWFDISIL